MAKKIVALGPGNQASGEVIRFKPVLEPWSEFECGDGTVLRLKVVVSEIIRIDDAFTPEGDPVYVVKSSNILHADVPEGLRRKTGEPGRKLQ